jgi:hypothetical protein
MLRTTNAAGRIRDESLINLGGRDFGPYHDTLIKFNPDSNYLGDEFISFSQVIIA